MKIIKAEKTGFCFGVERALEIVRRSAASRGGVETLGAIVHNQAVLDDLARQGVKVVNAITEISGDAVVTGAHGIGPGIGDELKARQIAVIDTTCPFVRRAQEAARKLADDKYFVIIYGEADHPEVTGILGWAGGAGLAATDTAFLKDLRPLPRRLGILSQTTQVPDGFVSFVGEVIARTFGQDSEFRCRDTICHDIRERVAAATRLANRVDLLFVVGGHNSANTRHLAELGAGITETHHVAAAAEITAAMVRGHNAVGITTGASTPEWVVAEVIARLESLRRQA